MKLSGISDRPGYKWVIVFALFLTVFTTLGFCSSNKSIYVVAVTEANGFSRALFSFNDSFRYVTTAVVNVFFGALVAKFGTKKLIMFGFMSLIASCVLNSVAGSLFIFYLAGALLGLGFSFTTTAMAGCVVKRWFEKNRGTVMGVILAANGLGGALAIQIVYPIVYDPSDPFGYRRAYRLIAAILLGVLIVAAVLLREKPRAGTPEDGGTEEKKRSGGEGPDFLTVRKSAVFWITAVCIFFSGFMLQGVSGIAAAHMKDAGLDDAFITILLSVGSVALTVSKFLTGFIYDRLGIRFTLSLCCGCAAITMVSLALISPSSSGRIAAGVYSVIHTLALPLETIMLPIFAGDLFGDKAFDKTLGIFVSFNTAGFALGSPVMNAVNELFGSYVPAFWVCAVLMLSVLAVMQFAVGKARALREGE